MKFWTSQDKKDNSKWNTDLNIRLKTIKLLNIRLNPHESEDLKKPPKT